MKAHIHKQMCVISGNFDTPILVLRKQESHTRRRKGRVTVKLLRDVNSRVSKH